MSRLILSLSLLLLLTLFLSVGAGRNKRRLLEFGVLLVLSMPFASWLWQTSSLPQISLSSLAPFSLHPMGIAFESALIIWGAGALLALIKLSIRLHGVKRWLKASAPLPRSAAAETALVLNLPKATVAQRFRQSQTERGPALLPAIPGRILLPAGWQSWSPSQRRAALHHEWHHAQNHDAHWSLLMDLMIALLWVHPLAWLLRSQWREEIEHQADRAALGQIEADEYASDLLRLVRTGHAPPPPIGVAFAHSSSSNRFRRRLLRLFETPNESQRSGAIAWVAAALLFAFTLLALSCHIRPDSAPEMTVETQLRLDANPFPADF